jgi:hypothetical protein
LRLGIESIIVHLVQILRRAQVKEALDPSDTCAVFKSGPSGERPRCFLLSLYVRGDPFLSILSRGPCGEIKLSVYGHSEIDIPAAVFLGRL